MNPEQIAETESIAFQNYVNEQLKEFLPKGPQNQAEHLLCAKLKLAFHNVRGWQLRKEGERFALLKAQLLGI